MYSGEDRISGLNKGNVSMLVTHINYTRENKNVDSSTLP
jgi:hypothetical protein